jgi:hypothetical protein
VEAEGSFREFNKWRFGVSQADEKVLLEAIRHYFSITASTQTRSTKNYYKNFYVLETTKRENCEAICRFFSDNPFPGHKRLDFESFRDYFEGRASG